MYRFSYMNTANFFLNKAELGTAAAASLLGGSLYGGSYVASKQIMGDELDPETYAKEVVANSVGGVASGLGGFLVTKAMNKKLGIV